MTPEKDLRISEEDFAAIKQSEAIVVGEWRNDESAEEWGEFLMCGTQAECKGFAAEHQIIIIPNGYTCLGKTVVLVKDLGAP